MKKRPKKRSRSLKKYQMFKAKLNPNFFTNPKLIEQREGVAWALKKLGKNKKVVVLSADLEESTRVSGFKKEYPERFFEVGVAEQSLAGIAAGLASCGKIPIISSFGVFSPGRNWEQIRISICYSKLPVVILGSHAGLSVGADGASHQALEDIALTRVLPNLCVVAPCDAQELEKAIVEAVRLKHPTYIRFHRQKLPLITQQSAGFKIGKAEIFCQGRDVTLIACGSMVEPSLRAACELEREKIKVELINLHTIKPLDEESILSSAKNTGAVVCAEEHQIFGGMGSAVAQLLAQKYPVPVEFIGVKDSFGDSGEAGELLEKYGLTKDMIKTKIKTAIQRKNLLR